MKIRLVSTMALSVISAASVAEAATVAANWAEATTWVSTSQNLSRTGSGATNGTGGYLYVTPYSDSVALNPSAGYTTPAGSIGTFYGGYKVTRGSSTTAFTPIATVSESATADRIRVSSNSGAFPSEVNLLVMFKKGNFLNGMNAATPLTIDNTVTGNLTYRTESGASGQVRYVIQDGSSYYVSETVHSPVAGGDFSLAFNPATRWASYNPGTDLEFTPTTFAAHTFTDIQGMGAYLERTRAANVSEIALKSFRLDAAFVPEPAMVGLLVVTVALSLMPRRRQA